MQRTECHSFDVLSEKALQPLQGKKEDELDCASDGQRHVQQYGHFSRRTVDPRRVHRGEYKTSL
jgi:hypothetical protein